MKATITSHAIEGHQLTKTQPKERKLLRVQRETTWHCFGCNRYLCRWGEGKVSCGATYCQGRRLAWRLKRKTSPSKRRVGYDNNKRRRQQKGVKKFPRVKDGKVKKMRTAWKCSGVQRLKDTWIMRHTKFAHFLYWPLRISKAGISVLDIAGTHTHITATTPDQASAGQRRGCRSWFLTSAPNLMSHYSHKCYVTEAT